MKRMSCMGDDRYYSSVNHSARKTGEGGHYFAVVQTPTSSTMATIETPEEDDRCDVKKVQSAFRLREDGALALQLQEHEFLEHYNRNKEVRNTARGDVKAAKSAFITEARDAGILSESQLQTIGMDEAWISHEIEAQVQEQEQLEDQRRQLVTMQDEEYAQYLQTKEKEKIEEARRKRLQKRLQRDNNHDAILTVEASKPPSSFHYDPTKFPDDAEVNGRIQVKSTMPKELPRIADKPQKSAARSAPNGRAKSIEEEIVEEIEKDEKRKDSQEAEDAEFARLVQEEEMVRQQRMVEDRDRRLALKLQRIETSEFKRQKSETEARQALDMPSIKPPHPEFEDEKKQKHRHDDSSESDRRSVVSSSSGGPSHAVHNGSIDRGSVGGLARQGVSLVKGSPRDNPSNGNDMRKTTIERAYTVSGSANSKDHDMARRDRAGYQAVVTTSSSDRKSQSLKTKPSDDGWSPGLARHANASSRNSNVPEPDYPGSGGRNNIAETIDPTFKRSSSKVNGSNGQVEEHSHTDPNTTVPVIQNVRRTRSNSKRAKSAKCKQQ